jgi:hypothetical protein
MSDAPKPSDSTSDNSTAQAAANTGKQKKPRSPVERVVVWGGISILLIIAGIQGMAAYGFTTSKDKVVSAVKRADESSDELNLNDAEELMSGFWSKSPIQKKNHERFIVYSWTGVYQHYSVLLNLGADDSNPIVMGYELNSETSNHAETIAASQPQSVSETADDSDDSTAALMEMPGGPGGGPGGPGGGPGGPGGGRPSIDWDELDKDGDGKVNKEEAPERMQQFFDRIDTSGDGFIDEEEREAMRRRREERQNSGGGPGGGGRPQRPSNDDDPPTATTPDEAKSNPDEPEPPKKPEDAAPQEPKDE